jgi:hypothetical protein
MVFAEDPGKDRVDMLGVVAKVELLLDLGRRQGGRDLGVGQKLGLEVRALLPDLHRVALHQPIGCPRG